MGVNESFNLTFSDFKYFLIASLLLMKRVTASNSSLKLNYKPTSLFSYSCDLQLQLLPICSPGFSSFFVRFLVWFDNGMTVLRQHSFVLCGLEIRYLSHTQTHAHTRTHTCTHARTHEHTRTRTIKPRQPEFQLFIHL